VGCLKLIFVVCLLYFLERLKVDETRAYSTVPSPEPPSLVELSPRSDIIPTSEQQTCQMEVDTPRSMPNLIVSADKSDGRLL
jgi:hypothetical protein